MQQTNSNTLGERLRVLRENRNLMQREIGAIIEVDGAFISKVENNEKPIKRNHLQKLSVFFNVDESELQALWLADKIRAILNGEICAHKAISLIYKEYSK